MNWIVIVILALIALFFFSLYWISTKDKNRLRGLLMQVLMDEKTYEFQREGLKKLVLNIEATDAMELSHRVNSSIDSLVKKIGDHTMLTSHSMLWEIKKNS